MKTYIINNHFKSTLWWWVYFCKLFEIKKGKLEDISEKFAIKNKLYFSDWNIQISFGSWTWYNVIKRFLPIESNIRDVSINL